MRINEARGAQAVRPSLSRKGNVIETGRYRITIKKDEILIQDKRTGDTRISKGQVPGSGADQKSIRIWGDPHVHTSDGDAMQFHESNLTLDLADGTKITITPTPKDANGKAWIDTMSIMNGQNAAVVRNIHGAGAIDFGEVGRNSGMVDEAFEDGTVLYVGNELDDLFRASDGQEIVGRTANGGEHSLDGLGGRSRFKIPDSWRPSQPFSTPENLAGELMQEARKVGDSIKDLKNQLSNEKDPDKKQEILLKIQEQMSLKQQLIQMATAMQKADDDTKRAIIANFRS